MTDGLGVALSVVKGLAAQGGILRYAQNDRHLLGMGDALGMGGRPRNDRYLLGMTDGLRVALSVVKVLAAQGGILRYAQNDRHLLGMGDGLRVALSVVKVLAAQGGILRYAQNDRHLLGMGDDLEWGTASE